MTIHDAAMTRFGQWWTRARRAGYAYANGYALHDKTAEKFRRREVARAVLFGGLFPLAAVLSGIVLHKAFFLLLLYYPAQAARTYLKRGDLKSGRIAYALSCTLSRFPELQGVFEFWRAQRAGRQAGLIEYK